MEPSEDDGERSQYSRTTYGKVVWYTCIWDIELEVAEAGELAGARDQSRPADFAPKCVATI